MVIRQDKMMSSATVCVSLAILLHLSDAVTVQLNAGQPGTIPCEITGTYSFPEWVKDATVAISNQGFSSIHPTLLDRFSFDPMNNRSLSISNVQTSDAGSYVCTHNGGTNSPQTTIVNVEESKNKEKTNGKEIETAKCACFVPAEVVVTVVIIICSYILINAYKECKHNKNIMEDKQKKKIKVVVILTIVEVLLFITVSIWFIVIQATVEDFEKLTKTELNATIALLVVEIVVFVQGVIAIFVFWKNRGSTNKPNADDPRKLDHLNYSTSTKKVQEPNQKATFI